MEAARLTRGPRRAIVPARLTTAALTVEAARMTQGPRRVTAPARHTTVAATVEATLTTRGQHRAITPARRTTAVAATPEAARMTHDQRRAIAPARRITVAGDTGRVLPLAALVLTTVAAAIQVPAPTTRAAAAARTLAGPVVARSQKSRTADLTIRALRVRRCSLDRFLRALKRCCFHFGGLLGREQVCVLSSRIKALGMDISYNHHPTTIARTRDRRWRRSFPAKGLQ